MFRHHFVDARHMRYPGNLTFEGIKLLRSNHMLHQVAAHMHKKTSYGFMHWIEQNIVIM